MSHGSAPAGPASSCPPPPDIEQATPGAQTPFSPLPASHGNEPPSAWVVRWSPLAPAGGTVLDVACGLGRHTRWFSERNHPVASVDWSKDAINFVSSFSSPTPVEAVVADIENGPWPFAGRAFDAVVVTNYLWRPLLPTLVQSVAPGGVLIYETFATGNASVGKPSRPDFLLRPGELLTICASLRVVAYEHGFLDTPARFVQRIAAVRPDAPEGLRRYPL